MYSLREFERKKKKGEITGASSSLRILCQRATDRNQNEILTIYFHLIHETAV